MVRESDVAPQHNATKKQKRTQGGAPSSDVILSAWVNGNEQVFPALLALHVPLGATILDVTFGRGVFWKLVDRSQYRVLGTDLCLDADVPSLFPDVEIKSGVDFGSLPFEASSVDAVVLDPPYMEGFYRPNPETRPGQGTHKAFRKAYSSGEEVVDIVPKGRLAWQDRVVQAYLRGAVEALRVLKSNGTLIVKCQDAVSANLQRLAHVEIITALESMGFYCKDLFVVVRPARAAVSRVSVQVHARKNHSYFLVFSKPDRPTPVRSCSTCRHPAR